MAHIFAIMFCCYSMTISHFSCVYGHVEFLRTSQDDFKKKTFSFDSSRLFVHMSPERKEIFGCLLMFIFFFLGENKKNCWMREIAFSRGCRRSLRPSRSLIATGLWTARIRLKTNFDADKSGKNPFWNQKSKFYNWNIVCLQKKKKKLIKCKKKKKKKII